MNTQTPCIGNYQRPSQLLTQETKGKVKFNEDNYTQHDHHKYNEENHRGVEEVLQVWGGSWQHPQYYIFSELLYILEGIEILIINRLEGRDRRALNF